MFTSMFWSDVFVLKCNLLCSQKMTGQSRCQFSDFFLSFFKFFRVLFVDILCNVQFLLFV